MLHPDEARAIVLRYAQPLPSERVPLDYAGGRVLARPLVASQSLPPFRASTMDGFAVRHDDKTEERRIIPGGLAGVVQESTVEPGTAARIMTGAPVPDGADAVVQVERTLVDGNRLRITDGLLLAGDNIRPVGADMVEGETVLPAGIRLEPAHLGLLASLGWASVDVGGRPRVAVFSTGDEVVAPDVEPGPGQIRDANRFSLSQSVSDAGGCVVLSRHIPDDETEVRSAFTTAIETADVIVTSGGVSMGDRDLVKALLGEFADVHFRRVFMKPGKPLNFATVGPKLVFGLPGNPVSSLVSFRMFAVPALNVMQGRSEERVDVVPVVLTETIQPSDRIEYQRAVVSVAADGRLTARSTGSQQSARLQSFVGANGYLVVPPSDQVIPAGSVIDAMLTAPPKAAP